MRLAGRRGALGHHIGLWAEPGYVLHYQPRVHAVRLQSLAEVRRLYGIEGFYRWRA